MGKIMHCGSEYGGGSGGSGGASAISDLTDVDLTNLSDGQILKYDATNQVWVNDDESGGSGGSAEFETTVLFDDTIKGAGTYTLDDDYENYDFITILGGVQSDESMGRKEVRTYSVGALKLFFATTNNKALFTGYYGRFFSFRISGSSIVIDENDGTQGLYTIYGHKLKGGGTGSGYSETVLFTGSGSESTYALSDSIQNYDLIEVQIKYLLLGDYRVPTLFPVSDFETGITYRATADDWYVGFVYTDDTTFTNADSRNAYITEIKGIKCGSSGSGGTASEIIPITSGTGANTQTFSFDKTPKRISVSYNSSDNWYGYWQFLWGDEYVVFNSRAKAVSISGNTIGMGKITYGADGKSFTITGHNAFGSWNQVNGYGKLLVEY